MISCRLCDEAIRNRLSEERQEEDEPAVRHLYVGETCRGCFTRFEEHSESCRKEDNFMWCHLRENHGITSGVAGYEYFDMKRAATDRDPLRRVVREAVRIRRIQDGEDETELQHVQGDTKTDISVKSLLLNSKDEFHLPKLVQVNMTQL